MLNSAERSFLRSCSPLKSATHHVLGVVSEHNGAYQWQHTPIGYILMRYKSRIELSMHPSHKHNLTKLNRISGQVEAVKRMISEEEYCVDIMTQIRAARSALKAVELSVLEAHMKCCLNQACQHSSDEQDKKIKEILTLLKKYE